MLNSSQGALFTVSEGVPIFALDDRRSALEQEVIRYYDETRQPLLRYLMSIGIAPSDGEEIVQEVFFSLFRHLQRGKSRENLRAWIFRVARNLALRQYRSRRRKPEEFFGSRPMPGQEPVDPLPNPEETTIEHDRQERLLAALSSLTELEQQSVHLRAEGLGYREIAKVLGIPLTTLSRLVGRSLQKLRRVCEA